MKEYTEEELWFHKKDQKIYGLMYRPKKAQKAPLIIICHGFGGSHKVNLVSADIYANAGYAVCSIDFCGGSDKTISDGSVMEMSVITEKEDLLAVVGQAGKLPYGDQDELVPIAYSEKAKDVFKNVEYHVIHGQGHSFYNEAGRKVDRMILEFLKTVC